jgi:hypothetical protein
MRNVAVGCLIALVALTGGCELDEEPLDGAGNGTGGMYYLRLADRSGAACLADEPGADIDAVALFVDGQRVAYAGWARYDPPAQATCTNGHTDAAAVTGPPELRATSGFLSLGGGAVVVGFPNDRGELEELLPGDEVLVFEGGATAGERFSVAVGPTETGPWTTVAADAGDGRTPLTFASVGP